MGRLARPSILAQELILLRLFQEIGEGRRLVIFRLALSIALEFPSYLVAAHYNLLELVCWDITDLCILVDDSDELDSVRHERVLAIAVIQY